MEKTESEDNDKVENFESPNNESSNNNSSLNSQSWLNGKVNRMKYKQLQSKLRNHGLDTNGNVNILRKRLKTFYSERNSHSNDDENDLCKWHFKYVVVIDYEATCEETQSIGFRHEIIEFPAILLDTTKRVVVDEFHTYVRPDVNPKLTHFCTLLTGITQKQVNKAPYFPKVFADFEEWLKKHDLFDDEECHFAVVADGSWDMGRFLYQQCKISNIPMPIWGKSWINMRKVFSNFYSTKRLCLNDMLSKLGMKFKGRLHSGIDDSRNISRIVLKLLEDGSKLRINEKLSTHSGNTMIMSVSRRRSRRKPKSARGADSADEDSDVLDAVDDYLRNIDPPIPVMNDEEFPELTFNRFVHMTIK